VRFSRDQRNLVYRALQEAEGHTSRYYCIPPYAWQELRYDLLTRSDDEWEPLPEAALARLRCLQKTSRSHTGPLDFYRIELNDPTILKAAERERLRTLYPFLVYILTHEMVHLVRLSSILNSAGGVMLAPEAEERRVDKISHQILANAGLPKIHPVLQRFCLSPPL